MDKTAFYNDSWTKWQGMIDNSPAPRHRRRIIIELAGRFSADIHSVADVGCGNGAQLMMVANRLGYGCRYIGYDVSNMVIEQNRKRYAAAEMQWKTLDLDRESIPGQYDLVICAEMLEHLESWETGLEKLLGAVAKHLIVTVPSGILFPIDRMVGHRAHFNRAMIDRFFAERPEFEYEVFFWGFPFHPLYKRAINSNPEKFYGEYAGREYGWKQKFLSGLLNSLFYLNVTTSFETNQMFLVAHRRNQL